MELGDLYAAVPAAEEEDLLEQVARERQDGAPEDAEPGPPEQAGQAEPDDPGYPLPQVLGLLEHELGAEVLPGDAPPQG